MTYELRVNGEERCRLQFSYAVGAGRGRHNPRNLLPLTTSPQPIALYCFAPVTENRLLS
jgi:hypothetical protein